MSVNGPNADGSGPLRNRRRAYTVRTANSGDAIRCAVVSLPPVHGRRSITSPRPLAAACRHAATSSSASGPGEGRAPIATYATSSPSRPAMAFLPTLTASARRAQVAFASNPLATGDVHGTERGTPGRSIQTWGSCSPASISPRTAAKAAGSPATRPRARTERRHVGRPVDAALREEGIGACDVVHERVEGACGLDPLEPDGADFQAPGHGEERHDVERRGRRAAPAPRKGSTPRGTPSRRATSPSPACRRRVRRAPRRRSRTGRPRAARPRRAPRIAAGTPRRPRPAPSARPSARRPSPRRPRARGRRLRSHPPATRGPFRSSRRPPRASRRGRRPPTPTGRRGAVRPRRP